MSRRLVIAVFAVLTALVVGLVLMQQFGAGPVEVASASAPENGAAEVGPSGADPESEQAGGQKKSERVSIPDAPIPEDAQASPSGVLIVIVVWPDGEPAEGVHVTLHTQDPIRAVAGQELTGGDGTVRFEQLPRCEASLMTNLGGRKWLKIEDGKSKEVRIELKGVAVAGVVVDEAGKSVADAEIWMTTGRRDWLGGRVATRSGRDGEFEIRCMPETQSLGALAAGYAPSALVDLDEVDTSKPPARVRLVVSEAGGAVSGTVTTKDGKLVAGAQVCLGKYAKRFKQRNGPSSRREAWTALVTTTDDQGSFRFPSVSPGTHPFAVWSKGRAIRKGEVEVQTGVTTQLPIELLTGVAVHGVVKDKAGAVVAGVVVRAYDTAISKWLIQGGQFDYESVFGFPFTLADEQGRFRLPGIAPGAIHLYATRARNPKFGGLVIRATSVLQGEDGAELVWNPILDPGHVISGSVTYRDGVPIAHAFVTAVHEQTMEQQLLRTDSKGKFKFVNMEVAAFTIRAQKPYEAPRGAGKLEIAGVWPDAGELPIVADFDSPSKNPPARVVGRVDDVAGRHSGSEAIEVRLVSSRGWLVRKVNEAGEFEFETPAGRFRLVAASGESVIYSGAWFDVSSAQKYDGGTLVTAAGGAFRVKFARSAGTETTDLRLFVRNTESGAFRQLLPGLANECVGRNFSVGRYQVSTNGEDVAATVKFINVVAGQTTDVKVAVRQGFPVGVELEFPKNVETGDLSVVIRDAEGAVAYQLDSPAARASSHIRRAWPRLPPGRCTIRATTTAGFVADRVLEVVATEGKRKPIRIVMKRSK